MSEELYELQQEELKNVHQMNAEFNIARQVDTVLENITPNTINAIIYSLVHQHPDVANAMLEDLGYYKKQGSF